MLYDYAFHIVATGYNGAPSGMDHCDDVKCELDSSGSCVRAVHAEMNALLQCAYYGVSTAGLNLLCTHSPCPRCAVALVRAGIVCVTYVNYYNGSAITARTLHEAGVQLRKYVEA